MFAYNNTVEESILSDKMCPLCGRESEKLKKEKIVFSNKANFIDFNLFEEKYLEVTSKLSSNIGEETEVITDELYAKLLRISIEYYLHIESYDGQSILYLSLVF